MNCYLCHSNQAAVFDRVKSFGYPLVYYQCGHCGLVFQSEEESRAADPEFYASTYREIYQSSEEPTAKDLWVQRQRARHLIHLLQRQKISSPQRALDIGASAGVLLHAYQDAFECEVTGVEPGDAYRQYAAGLGLKMLPSIEALAEKAGPKFDLVSLIHVLEHLSDPVGTLCTIRQTLLAADGVLLVEVPNFYTHDSYEVAHLACYTPHLLQEALQQAGFRVERIVCHGVPRSAMLNLYLTAIARPLPEGASIPTLKPESGVAFKRKLGLLYRRGIQKLFPRRAWLPLNPGKGS